MEKEEDTGFIPVKQWLEELLETWDDREAFLEVSFEKSNVHKISTLPQTKQAAYIAGMLKKYYVNKRK